MARRRSRGLFPPRLAEFREADWPPVPGECLEHYACRGDGYGSGCVPRAGEQCGAACYAHLAAEYPDRPEVLAAAKRADAFTRYHAARLAWLGEDHPDFVTEFFDGDCHDQIRYAPFRQDGGAARLPAAG